MMTIRFWVGLKNKIARKLGFRKAENAHVEEVKDGMLGKEGEEMPMNRKESSGKLTKVRK